MAPSLRPIVEFLVVLAIGILVSRSFAAEAYIVPTGSMAPTLLGTHREYICPDCEFRFSLGIDDTGRAGRPVCPNCGNAELEKATRWDCHGDRLLVQKHLFEMRPPRRWEVAVFQNPADAGQAYVKRVVGLPTEEVFLRGGEVFIDGQIARKTLAEQRAMRILVYDHNHRPRDLDRYPRWSLYRLARGGTPGPSGWGPEGSSYIHQGATGTEPTGVDWIVYRHWQPDGGHYGPVRDFTPYNGADLPGENRVEDLMLSARVALDPGCRALIFRLSQGADRFEVRLPLDGSPATVRRGSRSLALTQAKALVKPSSAAAPRFHTVEASLFDRRLTVAVDGALAFAPYDYDDPRPGPRGLAGPLMIGVEGPAWAEVRDLRIDRDVYYTEALAGTPRRPFGVDRPFRLGKGEYFVLGDNSPVSNDSRFWPDSPVVKAERLLGKPFLVHLPSRVVPLTVFGRDVYWIPDPREIRYIR